MQKSNSLKKFEQLPEEIKVEVLLYGNYLLEKKKSKRKRVPKFGGGKGLFKYVSPDFDAPLEDFKDYM
jgi:hypothetical protein